MTVIEIKPHRWGWKAFEAPGVEPVFPKKDQAIDYAHNGRAFAQARFRFSISSGNVERVIPFDDANRKLWCRDFTATCRDPDPVGDVSKATLGPGENPGAYPLPWGLLLG